jgi:hypothetical protein
MGKIVDRGWSIEDGIVRGGPTRRRQEVYQYSTIINNIAACMARTHHLPED